MFNVGPIYDLIIPDTHALYLVYGNDTQVSLVLQLYHLNNTMTKLSRIKITYG